MSVPLIPAVHMTSAFGTLWGFHLTLAARDLET
jgi:hypothetical protein